MILLVATALAHTERTVDREPVAWALEVSGKIARQDGSWLDQGEAIEPGARFELPVGAVAVVAHNGRLERWEGPGSVRVTEEAVRLTLAGQTVRWPHVEEIGSSLGGDVRVPRGRGQAVTALGIPRTPSAWARQDAIDGGALHALYRDRLRDRLAAAGVDPVHVAELGLTDALAGDIGEQVALVGGYLDLARATPNGAILFELLPTNTDLEALSANLGGTFVDSLVGKRPHTFRVGPGLDKIRVYGLDVAEALRRAGHEVYALVVPYANLPENIFARAGKPDDGVQNLHALLVRAGGRDEVTRTVAFGYSQGGTVVDRYVATYGDSDGLDAAIAVATMGGVGGVGSDGMWAGRAGKVLGDGLDVLAVVHARDPARRLHGKSTLAMLPALVNFLQEGRPKGDEGILHGTYFGATGAPIAPSADPVAALEAGTLGYPTAYLAPLYDDLLAGRYTGDLRRLGDWAFDLRVDLPGRDDGDFVTTRLDPKGVADGFRSE